MVNGHDAAEIAEVAELNGVSLEEAAELIAETDAWEARTDPEDVQRLTGAAPVTLFSSEDMSAAGMVEVPTEAGTRMTEVALVLIRAELLLAAIDFRSIAETYASVLPAEVVASMLGRSESLYAERERIVSAMEAAGTL